MHLILASASPRRAELLRSAGFEFDIEASNVAETPQDGEEPAAYTRRVARDKAQHVAAGHQPDVVVLAADTEVVAGGRILGKPANEDAARQMLRSLSAAEHEVITAVAIVAGDRAVEEVTTTRVWFAELTAGEIEWYVASGEPMDKAGAYAIQGVGARFVERIDGSWSSVVGLPLATVHRLLAEVQ